MNTSEHAIDSNVCVSKSLPSILVYHHRNKIPNQPSINNRPKHTNNFQNLCEHMN